MDRRRFLAWSAVATSALAGLPVRAQEAGTQLRLSFGPIAEQPMPRNYLGFSCETMQLADPTFFAADNQELVALFKILAPEGILRLGGNSSEFCWWKAQATDQPPELPESARRDDNNWMPRAFTAIEPVAVDRLAEFLAATGWKVIYNLNLGTGTPERDAEEAAYVSQKLGGRLLYFQIGNEPEYYRDANNRLRGPDWNFDQYLVQWLSFARAVLARVPEARFGGPDVGSNTQWVTRFAREATQQLPGKIVACSGHYYVMGPPDNPRSTVERLLAPDARVDREVPRMVNAATETGLVYRMTEGNSCYRGGKPGVSNAFCSALWGADYLLRLASFGCAGVNLHGGGAWVIRSSLGGHLPGENLTPDGPAIAKEGSFYTPIAGSREMGFKARPLFYGMKLAGVLTGGRMRPVTFDTPPANASAWAAEMPEGQTRLVLINKDARKKLVVTVPANQAAQVWRLTASDLTATAGVTLAGVEISPKTPWQPADEKRIGSSSGEVVVELPPASAAALFFPSRL